MRRLLLGVAVLPSLAFAQSPAPKFTVDDMLDVVNHSVVDLSADGRWLAVKAVAERQRLGQDYARTGDPTYTGAPRGDGDLLIIDTRTGESTKPFAGVGGVRSASWSPDGSQLLALVKKGEMYEPVIWNRTTKRIAPVPIPATHYAAENSEVKWTPDGREVVLSLRTMAWRREATAHFKKLLSGPVVVMSSREPFLGWEVQQRFGGQRSVVAIDVAKGTQRELLAETRITGAVQLSDDGTRLAFAKDTLTRTPYAKLTVPGKRQAVAIATSAGERSDRAERQARLEGEKDTPVLWSADGATYTYGKDGRIFAGSLGGAERQIAGPAPDSAKGARPTETTAAVSDSARARRAKETFTVVRLDPRAAFVLASNSEGFWEIDPSNGTKRLVVRSDTAAGTPLYRFIDMSRDGGSLYFSGSVRTQWERGLYRYDRTAKALQPLVKDANRYDNARLSPDGSTLIYAMGQGSRPTELYAMDVDGKNVRRLTKSNPRFDDPRLTRTELLSYLDVDGRRQFGVLYYPADYEAGKKYPTILHLYEQFFDEEYEGTNKVLLAAGYAILRPSVPTRADPGFASVSWMKGATAAANKIIEMGVADSARVGVYGCSYGGFATSLLVTQTNRFKAAISIAPPVDLISMYTDSPRLVMRNMAFSEASGTMQLNIGATLWEQPQKYVQNSAIMFADRIKTPLLILSGTQDHNVPMGQAAELFYALRRLGREVEWVNYTNGGHCMPYTTEDDFKDYNGRILEWFDRHLKKTSATSTDGTAQR